MASEDLDTFIEGLGRDEVEALLAEAYDYEEMPVGINEFIDSDDFLGPYFEDIEFSDYWRRVLNEIYPSPFYSAYWLVALKGSIGRGKCVAEGTLIPTDKGLYPVEDLYRLFHRGGMPVQVPSEDGMRPVQDMIHDGTKAAYEVQDDAGNRVVVSADHRFRVWNTADASVQWARAADLCAGDCLVSQRAPANPDRESDYEGARKLGEVTGRVVTHSTSRLFRILRRRLMRDHRIDSPAGPVIPGEVLRGSLETRIGYLDGLASVAGTANDRCLVLPMWRESLVGQVMSLLASMGVRGRARRRKGRNPAVTVSSTDLGALITMGLFNRPPRTDREARVQAGAFHLSGRVRSAAGQRSYNNDPLPGAAGPCREIWRALRRDGRVEHDADLRTALLWDNKSRQDSRSLTSIRDVGRRFPEYLDAHPDLAWMAAGDKYISRVASVRPVGERPMYDLSVAGSPTYTVNGFITHNTTTACVMMAYDLYRLLCLRNPQRNSGLVGAEKVLFAIFNVTQSLSGEVWERLTQMFLASPWFYNALRIKDFKRKPNQTLFPKRVDIFQGSRIQHSLGKAVYEALLDESDFEIVSGQVYRNFQSILRRMETRFMDTDSGEGGVLGKLLVVSSEGDKFSVINKIVESYANKPGIYVDRSTPWSVFPHRYTSGKWFPVFTGSYGREPYIIKGEYDEDGQFTTDDPTLTRETGHVIWVPHEHRIHFEANLYDSLRDLAGVPVVSKYRLFGQRERVHKALTVTPIFPDVIQLRFDDPEDVVQNYANVPGYFAEGGRFYPDYPRYIHIDIAINGDRLGFASSLITGFVEREVQDPNSLEVSTEMQPEFFCEFAFSLQALPGQQIPLYKVRAFIQWLTNRDWMIGKVSTDGFQSADGIQSLRRMGYKAELLSVDRTSVPYIEFRNAVYEGRWAGPQSALLNLELENLELSPDGKKVNHPTDTMDDGSKPSKDIADAVAGSYKALIDDSEKLVFNYIGTAGAPPGVAEEDFALARAFWGKDKPWMKGKGGL